MRRAITLFVMICVLCAAAVGCSSGASSPAAETNLEVPNYVLVDKDDIPTAEMSREAFWVATSEAIDEEDAKAIAIDVSSESKSIDEVTVWIFDTEEAINKGLITMKKYDVIIEKGRVVDVIENELYGK